ncbi:FAD binding domain-containing protein [Apodospora peruviana]|uniref:FAD binding domain-containing protein n=1 Tax=Apodospora peruviana TaxID=516989 RepID=A0AAE0LYG0_9PEZI|nr:FAD binding domain-containing protein [Apodospora peruviana]
MATKPIIIIGAGFSGLLLAQHLRKSDIPFVIFERDADFSTRGAGWGLTLHWSLPALRSLLPDELIDRLPETYVDLEAVERGEASTFSFFDLSTGELKGASPKAPESQRIRVTREKLRRLLATGIIDIQWGKAFSSSSYNQDADAIVALFEDGSTCFGGILVGCNGSRSRVRRDVLPEYENEMHKIPVGVLGAKVDYTPEQIGPLRELDPFFFQWTSSENDTNVYFSILDAPGNIVSWPLCPGFFGVESIIPCPSTSKDRLDLIQTFAQTWAEPFRSLVLDIPEGTDIKPVELHDWLLPKKAQSSPSHPVALIGECVSLHGHVERQWIIDRGEGANHAILDVLDFATSCASYLSKLDQPPSRHRDDALERYGHQVIERVRPAVLASRQACMDAHDWKSIGPDSPLLSRRMIQLQFDDESLGWD